MAEYKATKAKKSMSRRGKIPNQGDRCVVAVKGAPGNRPTIRASETKRQRLFICGVDGLKANLVERAGGPGVGRECGAGPSGGGAVGVSIGGLVGHSPRTAAVTFPDHQRRDVSPVVQSAASNLPIVAGAPVQVARKRLPGDELAHPCCCALTSGGGHLGAVQ